MSEDLTRRLKKARENVGLTLKEAASRLGFPSYQTLSKIESGQREVRVAELTKFAQAYFCSLSDFLAPDIPKETPHIQWRCKPDPTKKKAVERRVIQLSEQVALMEGLLRIEKQPFNLLPVTLNDICTNRHIDHLAEKAACLLKLGQRPALSLAKVLEQEYGVNIIYCPLAGSAASMVHPESGPVIVINGSDPPWRRKFDLAHELFHLITKNVVTKKMLDEPSIFKDTEKKADRFASALLLPREEVISELEKRVDENGEVSNGDIVEVARDFGVSTQALIYRLCHFGIIQFEEAKEILADENLQSINRNVRAADWGSPPVPERLIALAIRCLRKGLLSRGKFAEIVGINRADINDFVAERGLLSSEGDKIAIMAR